MCRFVGTNSLTQDEPEPNPRFWRGDVETQMLMRIFYSRPFLLLCSHFFMVRYVGYTPFLLLTPQKRE